MKKKEILRYYEYYSSEIKTPAYFEFKKRQEEDRQKEGSFFDSGEILCTKVTFCDVCSNEDVAELVKRIHKLPAKRFYCKPRHRKPNFFKQYNYVHLDNGVRRNGIFEEIKVLGDPFIESITMTWSQINNYSVLIEYEFLFSKIMSDADLASFVEKKINEFSKRDFISERRIHECPSIDYLYFGAFVYETFVELCQHYITTYLYSRYAKEYSLPHIVWLCSRSSLNFSKLLKRHIGPAYYNRKENYLVLGEPGSFGYQLLSQNGTTPQFSVSNLVMLYGSSFYYSFLGGYEEAVFNNEFTKYTSQGKNVPFHRLILLLNRSQGLREGPDFKKELECAFSEKWTLYNGGDEYTFCPGGEYFRSLYENAFEYFKTISDLFRSKTSGRIAVFALLVSVASLLVALITLLVGIKHH